MTHETGTTPAPGVALPTATQDVTGEVLDASPPPPPPQLANEIDKRKKVKKLIFFKITPHG